MQPARAQPEPKILVDYMSTESPTVTHVRGILLANAIGNLQSFDQHERYLELLPRDKHEAMSSIIASSWVPLDLVLLHYATADKLGVTDEQLTWAAEQMAERIAQTFLGLSLRAAHSLGIQSCAVYLGKNDRIFQRMYRGGGTTVLERGPKELILEDHGNPLLGIPRFRFAYLAYMNAIMRYLCKTAYVTQVRPRVPHPHCMATRFSWV